jgi:putative restriction endonuclease
MSQRPDFRYWWVNHKQSATQGLTGDYLWSPQRNKNGSANESFRNMALVQPGDLVFAFSNAAVRGVGIALRSATEAAQPIELSRSGKTASSVPGWHLPVRFLELDVPLNPKAHMAALKPVLPKKYAPLRPTGVRNPAVYLASISEAMADVLRHLLAAQVEDVEAQLKSPVGSELADDWMETTIRHRTDIGPEEKQKLIRARRGQGVFRRNLEKIENSCRLTGLLDRRHLRACHIKPWSVSEDREKLDGCNGVLFSPHIAHLFSRGYISFADDGELLVSRHLNPAVLKSWKLRLPMSVGAFQSQQCTYLDYHRREVFDKQEIGRRAAQ